MAIRYAHTFNAGRSQIFSNGVGGLLMPCEHYALLSVQAEAERAESPKKILQCSNGIELARLQIVISRPQCFLLV